MDSIIRFGDVKEDPCKGTLERGTDSIGVVSKASSIDSRDTGSASLLARPDTGF